MTTPIEENLINTLATHAQAIDGITNAYQYAQNPDAVTQAALPAVLFWPMRLTPDWAGHHNLHKNELIIRGSVLAIPRLAQGGKLKFIENNAIDLMQKFRAKFQSADVIRALLNQGVQKALMSSIQYGSGGVYLTHAGIEYVGLIVDWQFIWTC